MKEITSLFISIAVVLLCAVFFLARNSVTHTVRISFIDGRACPCAYDKLPTYQAMLYNPAYWTIWTKDGWMQWIERTAP